MDAPVRLAAARCHFPGHVPRPAQRRLVLQRQPLFRPAARPGALRPGDRLLGGGLALRGHCAAGHRRLLHRGGGAGRAAQRRARPGGGPVGAGAVSDGDRRAHLPAQRLVLCGTADRCPPRTAPAQHPPHPRVDGRAPGIRRRLPERGLRHHVRLVRAGSVRQIGAHRLRAPLGRETLLAVARSAAERAQPVRAERQQSAGPWSLHRLRGRRRCDPGRGRPTAGHAV